VIWFYSALVPNYSCCDKLATTWPHKRSALRVACMLLLLRTFLGVMTGSGGRYEALWAALALWAYKSAMGCKVVIVGPWAIFHSVELVLR
jgi:hypothetical protein